MQSGLLDLADLYERDNIRKTIESLEDGLEDIPKDGWKDATSTKNWRCPKCALFIAANSSGPPHIHKRKPPKPPADASRNKEYGDGNVRFNHKNRHKKPIRNTGLHKNWL